MEYTTLVDIIEEGIENCKEAKTNWFLEFKVVEKNYEGLNTKYCSRWNILKWKKTAKIYNQFMNINSERKIFLQINILNEKMEYITSIL